MASLDTERENRQEKTILCPWTINSGGKTRLLDSQITAEIKYDNGCKEEGKSYSGDFPCKETFLSA